jgi:hypothetical protein
MELKSLHKMNRVSETGASARDQDPPAPSVFEVRQTLTGARDVTRALLLGRPQAEVARRVRDPLTYGIGAMIFQLTEKKILSCEGIAYRSLLSGISGFRTGTGAQAPANRRTVIEHLRKNYFISDSLPVKALKPAGTTPTVAHVLKVTEQVTGISVTDILSRDRSRDIVTARFFAMWSLRAVSGTSFSVIGDRIGGKDHTTVINAVNQIEIKRSQGERDRTDQIVDESDLIGIKTNMDLLTRNPVLRAV